MTPPSSPTSVRPPAVAGMFYPAAPTALRASLDDCLGSPNPAVPPAPTFERIKALIVPHAGYVYSGAIAGKAYARLAPLAGTISRVVLLGPCHRVAVRGLAMPSVAAFATPLGKIPLDRRALDALIDQPDLPQIVVSDAAHAEEHSLEVQLPFLQTLLGDFELLPFAVGQTTATEVADVLERLWDGPQTLIVISSDLSHFHPYREAQRLDNATVSRILALESLDSHEQACGALPVNGLLELARRKGLRIQCVAQCNSGDTPQGDTSRVVGYASFVLHETDRGAALVLIARNAIAAHLGVAQQAMPTPPPLGHAYGASFVTLTLDGELRGCIGTLEAHQALDTDVAWNAVCAASRDPRFPPLTAEEFERTQVEVSLLSAPQPMRFTDEADLLRQLRPGIDGVILRFGDRRATFLPQVWDQLPDPHQFMARLKQKAGLPADWWSPEARIQRYEVEKWKEADPP